METVLSWIEQTGRFSWRFIADEGQLREVVGALRNERLLGLDTETYWNPGAKGMELALVQIAPPEGEVIVADVLATGVEPLRALVESPEVKMVAHNARFDEAVLRGAGLLAAGLIDTLRLSRMALTLGSHSLAALSEHLFGLPIDKTLQKSNWRRRPLTRAQLEYAALDARMALLVYGELTRMLAEEGRLELALRVSELAPAEPKEPGKEPRKRRKVALPEIVLTPEEKRLVASLKKWRLERANAQRVPAYMICPDRTLEHLARERPETLEALASIYGLGESKIRNFGEDLLKALRESCG
ncbi:MAG TPA: HRDC domain-containing protein [Pyrinomonadaceae bacterium]|nr:HRDC domain-containing protein [Pyrinomonadaceae bacterium]